MKNSGIIIIIVLLLTTSKSMYSMEKILSLFSTFAKKENEQIDQCASDFEVEFLSQQCKNGDKPQATFAAIANYDELNRKFGSALKNRLQFSLTRESRTLIEILFTGSTALTPEVLAEAEKYIDVSTLNTIEIYEAKISPKWDGNSNKVMFNYDLLETNVDSSNKCNFLIL